MIRVYIAGAMSDSYCLNFLKNIKKGIRAATRLITLGYAPFCPMVDFQYFFFLEEGEEITGQQIKAYSMEWLKACHYVMVLPGSEESIGTRDEIIKANELGIPVYDGMESFLNRGN